MKLSISTGMYYKKSYMEILDIISETSCKNIELMFNQSFIDENINDIEKYIQRKNLNITSIHNPLTFIAYPRNENERFWIEKTLEYGRVFDIDTIVSHMVLFESIGLKDNTLDKLHMENMISYKESSIKVCTENLPSALKNSVLGNHNEFVDFVKSNNLNMYYDTTHDGFNGLPILNDFDNIKKHISNIHISDYKDGNEHLMIGEGDYPFERLFDELKKMNYKNNLTLEFDFENPIRSNIKNDDDAINKLQFAIDYIERIK